MFSQIFSENMCSLGRCECFSVLPDPCECAVIASCWAVLCCAGVDVYHSNAGGNGALSVIFGALVWLRNPFEEHQ